MTSVITNPIVNSVEKSEESVKLMLTIPEKLHYFEGHFPQAAILPGVVQVHWVLGFIRDYFDKPVENYQSIDALKFQVIIGPNYQIELELKAIKETKIAFSYSSVHGQHSSGKVVYK